MLYENQAARWQCLKCNNRSNSRRNRMRDHVAQCLGYKLYPCGGSCGMDNWYEPLFDPMWQISSAKDHVVAIWNSKPNRTFTIIEIPNGGHVRNGTPSVFLANIWIPSHRNCPVARQYVVKTSNATCKINTVEERDCIRSTRSQYTVSCTMLRYSPPHQLLVGTN